MHINFHCQYNFIQFVWPALSQLINDGGADLKTNSMSKIFKGSLLARSLQIGTQGVWMLRPVVIGQDTERRSSPGRTAKRAGAVTLQLWIRL